MHLKLKLLMVLLILVTVCCNGQEIKEQLNLPEFTSVNMGISGDLYIKQGNTQEVIVETSREIFDDLEIEVRGNNLSIRKKSTWRNFKWGSDDKVIVHVTVKELEGLHLSGSGKVESQGTIRANDLDLSVSGSGKLSLNTSANRLESHISGSGRMSIEGKSRSNEIHISGSGRLEAEDLEVEDYDVSISGSGNCRIHVTESINARISGSGSVYYHGNPDRVNSKVSGSGKVRKI